jgi:Nif-specific regulatory protein
VGGRETLRADARLICATHRDLELEVEAGRFRQDLFYRVRVVEIAVPTLRRRGDGEIEALLGHFAAEYARRHGRVVPRFSAAMMAALREHSWPGNVRELEHWVESAVVLADDDGEIAIPPPRASRADLTLAPGGVALGLSLADATRAYIRATVDACGGSRTEAARRLGIGRNTVTRALKAD